MATLEGTTVIVGAGIFGTSTAYHLSQAQQGTVIVIDQHDLPTPAADSPGAPPGASHDINKVVRADYASLFHMKMALEAMDEWRTWGLISPFYHQTGWKVLCGNEDGMVEKMETIRQNFRDCKGLDGAAPLRDNDVGMHLESDGSERCYTNPNVAWAEADKAVATMLSKAIDNGVKYVRGTVSRLVLHSNSTGVKEIVLQDGSTIGAQRVLLATGPWTSALMHGVEDYLTLPDDERMESQWKAAGVCNVHVALKMGTEDQYMSIPILIKGSLGEVLPPPASRLLKFNNSTSFTNTVRTKSGREITRPPAGSQFEGPAVLQQETIGVARKVLPNLPINDANISFFRVCWDAVTPEQHQLITRHPKSHLENVFLAVGGSFRGWKFLPIIGKYVSNVLRGISNGPEKDEAWGWKWGGWAAATGGGAHSDLIPTREFVAFLQTK